MSVPIRSFLAAVGLACCSSAFGSSPWSLSASLDYYAPHGTPNIGTVGWVESRHINRLSPVVAVDYAVKDWLSFELNYRYTPRFTVLKISGGSYLFPLPPGSGALTVLTPFSLSQTINTVSFGPNCSLKLGHGFRLSAGVYAAYENVSSDLQLVHWSNHNSLRPSTRVRLEYSVTASTSVLASWTFIDSASTSASYLGLGAAHRF